MKIKEKKLKSQGDRQNIYMPQLYEKKTLKSFNLKFIYTSPKYIT